MAMTMLFERIEDVCSLAQIIVETVREPLLVLDHDLKVLVASSSFHKTFDIDPKDTPEQVLFALDKGAWDIPALHTLLENSLADQAVVEGFLVDQEFPRIGRRIFLLHARKVLDTKVGQSLILLGFEDITGRRAVERDKEILKKQTDDLLQQKEILLAEMQHRIINSLQIMRQHIDDEGAGRVFGRDPRTSEGRASPRHVGGGGAAASAQFRPCR